MKSVTCAARNLLRKMDTAAFSRMCYISTTTLNPVSSSTHPHSRGPDSWAYLASFNLREELGTH
jgi:hypothetical protein